MNRKAEFVRERDHELYAVAVGLRLVVEAVGVNSFMEDRRQRICPLPIRLPRKRKREK